MYGFSSITPPYFNGDNYPVWVVKMRSFLKVMNLWEFVESDADPPPLGSDPTLAQIKKYEEDKAKKHKALTFNPMRLYDEALTDQKVVEKIIISVPDKFEAKIAAIEESCDLKKLTIAELISKLQAQEQRASIRVEGVTEGHFSFANKSKGYKVYNLEAKKIIVSRDVEVDESTYWSWDKWEPQKKFDMVQSVIDLNGNSASLLSRFMNTPSQSHLGAAKRVLRYLKGTADYGIWFLKKKKKEAKLEGYSDSDWAGCVDDSKSTSGYVFSFGSGVFCWNSRKQEVVAQSTTEAKYISAAAAKNQAIWLRKY
ncbi:hypothetical protein GH714_034706 [Hevea brasiliensis]|uniref:Uncharacterized protein n=1 Tax=Hevea brasiliensis TaxID=3981 RepID=A0A6A6NCZ7_HEVBR|nr:hypothetical protein GH714_034706 [Hevea brasiliensis]